MTKGVPDRREGSARGVIIKAEVRCHDWASLYAYDGESGGDEDEGLLGILREEGFDFVVRNEDAHHVF